MQIQRVFTSAGLALLLYSLAACTFMGTPVAEFDMLGTGRTIGPDGAELAPGARKLVKLPIAAGRASPFPDLRYEGPLHSADLTISSLGIFAVITNTTGSPIRLRFDQASFTSNFQPEEMPVAVFSAHMKDKSVYLKKGQSQLLAVPPLPLQAGERAAIDFQPSYIKVFPSKRLFDVRFVDKQPVLAASGLGNTVTLRVPVEHDGMRSTWVLELSARQSAARNSYH